MKKIKLQATLLFLSFALLVFAYFTETYINFILFPLIVFITSIVIALALIKKDIELKTRLATCITSFILTITSIIFWGNLSIGP